jgi:hypothetical protein
MRKTGMSFRQIYKITKRFFKKIKYKEEKNSQRDRPRKYKDEFIIAIFPYQTLKLADFLKNWYNVLYIGS